MLNSRIFSQISTKISFTRSQIPLSTHKVNFTSSSSSSSTSTTPLSKQDLIRLLAEKNESIKSKQTEIEKLQSDLLRNNTEIMKMENNLNKNPNEQKFAKSLVDVYESLGRVLSACHIEPPKDLAEDDLIELVHTLRKLYPRIFMVRSQLQEVIPDSVFRGHIYPSSVVVKRYNPRKVEKYEPRRVEKYYPNRGNAAKPATSGTKILTTWTH